MRELPLFPLPVVLFPGMPMPLHIFEPRYRKMLADIRAANNLFGLSYFDAGSSGKEIPPTGHIGCVAEVTETQGLPDGISCSESCQKIPGETSTFIAALASKTQAATTCIPPGRTGRLTLRTTIGAAVNRPEASILILGALCHARRLRGAP